MQSIVVQPKNNSELKFITDLLGKLGIRSSSISEELTEDLGLSLMMREADASKKVSEEEIMRKLGRK